MRHAHDEVAGTMNQRLKTLLRGALGAYLEQLEHCYFEPARGYLPYGLEGVDEVAWPAMNGEMVKDELRELTNGLNSWHSDLVRWDAWNTVLQAYADDDSWDIRLEFVEPLAHASMLLPASTRDQIVFVATNATHQIRLAMGGGYRDYLEGDPTKAGANPQHLSRRRKEARLRGIVSCWPEGAALLAGVYALDDAAHKAATADYRNRSSHGIAPRFEIGITRTVTREVVPADDLVAQGNGTFRVVPSPDKLCVRYGYGGTQPLDLKESFAANLEQYRSARSCFERYRALLLAGLRDMPKAGVRRKSEGT